nr:radial spoke head protein 9 homolog isoform X1 [Vulpes vulpes]
MGVGYSIGTHGLEGRGVTPNSFSWASSLKRRGGGRKPGNQDHEDVVGSLNCMEWSLLPPATEEMAVETSVVKGRFMGDPSHEYEHTELQKMKEGEKVFEEEVVVQIKEENRLVSVIDQIDKAVAVIPRGALFKTPFGPIHVNRTFEGLSLSEAKKLSSYFHFREPVELKNKTLLEKADLDPSLDFMDSLEHDIPKGNSLLLGGHWICPQVRAVGHAVCHSPLRLEPTTQVGTGGSWRVLVGGASPQSLVQGSAYNKQSVHVCRQKEVPCSMCFHRQQVSQCLF